MTFNTFQQVFLIIMDAPDYYIWSIIYLDNKASQKIVAGKTDWL